MSSKKSKSGIALDAKSSKQSISSSKKSKEEPVHFLYKDIPIKTIKEVLAASDVYIVEKTLKDHLKLTNIDHDIREMIMLDNFVSAMWLAKESQFNEEKTAALYIMLGTQLKNIEKGINMLDNLLELRSFFISQTENCRNKASDISLAESRLEDSKNISQGDDNVNDTNMPKVKESNSNLSIQSEKISRINVENSDSLNVRNKDSLSSDQKMEIAKLFEIEDVKKIFNFCKPSIYQHYHLFEYFYTQPQDSIKIQECMEIEVPCSISLPAPLLEAISEKDFILFENYMAMDTDEKKIIQGQRSEVLEEKTLDDNSKLENYLIGQMSNEEIQKVIASVFDEVICEYEVGLNQKLELLKNDFLGKINIKQALKLRNSEL